MGHFSISDQPVRWVNFRLPLTPDTLAYQMPTGERYFLFKPGSESFAPGNKSGLFETFQFLRNETKEYFISLHLDGKNRIVAVEIVSIGSLNQSIVHPREVFKTALLSSAAAIIILHNHPSGDTAPSREDIEITKRLKEAGELLGIRILDHIIIGETYRSFVEGGLL